MALRLIIEDDEGTTTIVPLGPDAITIGRQQGNTIQLTEKNVSRRHARLYPDGDGWILEDLGSYNRTRVNGQPIEGRVVLNEGDVVQIGDYHLALTEDADKRALNFEARDAANDGEALALASSSNELQRLSQDEVAALQSGPPLVPIAAASIHDSGRISAGFPVADDRSRSASVGVLIAVGVVITLLSSGAAAWFVYGQPSLTPQLALGGTSTQAYDAPRPSEAPRMIPPDAAVTVRSATAPSLEPTPAPRGDGVVVTPGTPDAVPEAPPARVDADTAGTVDDPSPAAIENAGLSTARSALDPYVPPPPAVLDENAAAAKKARRRPTVTGKAEPPAPPEVTPEPPPAPKPPGPDVEQLLAEARTLQFKDPGKAYALASQAFEAKRSQDALIVMAFSACRIPDAASAKKAIAKLRGKARDTVVSACQKAGVGV